MAAASKGPLKQTRPLVLGQRRRGAGPHLGEVQPHLLAVEVRLVQPQPGLGRRQRIAEADPDPPERLEVLERHLRVERAEQSFETTLEGDGEG